MLIRWFETEAGPCVHCRRPVGSGPVGFAEEDPAGPVCDPCLLSFNADLGMLLTMANVSRELAARAAVTDDPWEADQQMVALMASARIYHQGSDWPARRVAAMEVIQELLQVGEAFLSFFATSELGGGPSN